MPDEPITHYQDERLRRAWVAKWGRQPYPSEIEAMRTAAFGYAERMRMSKAVTHATDLINRMSTPAAFLRAIERKSDNTAVPTSAIRRDIEPHAWLLGRDPVEGSYIMHPIRRTSTGLWFLPSPTYRRGIHGRLESGQLFLLRRDVPPESMPREPETRLRLPMSSALLAMLVDGSALPLVAAQLDEPEP